MADAYLELKKYFAKIPDVELPGAKGAQGLKYKGKMFVMFYKGDLIVKLPEARVIELVSTKKGILHDPGTGKAMKDRLLIPASKMKSWIRFCEESLRFVQAE